MSELYTKLIFCCRRFIGVDPPEPPAIDRYSDFLIYGEPDWPSYSVLLINPGNDL